MYKHSDSVSDSRIVIINVFCSFDCPGRCFVDLRPCRTRFHHCLAVCNHLLLKLIYFTLLWCCLSNHDSSCHIGQISLILASVIHEDEIPVFNRLAGRNSMKKRCPCTGNKNSTIWLRVSAFHYHVMGEFGSKLLLGNSDTDIFYYFFKCSGCNVGRDSKLFNLFLRLHRTESLNHIHLRNQFHFESVFQISVLIICYYFRFKC